MSAWKTMAKNAAVTFVGIGAFVLLGMWFAVASQLAVGVFNEPLFYVASCGNVFWAVVFFASGWLKLYED